MTRVGPCQVQRLTLEGHPALRLANGSIQVDILPSLGGKIWNLLHVPSQTQWIWHNPQVPLGHAKPGTCYDDVWAGGWEELFPNDAPGVVNGRVLPDHGNWWSRSWDSQVMESPVGQSVVLSLDGGEIDTHCEKRIELDASSSRLTIHYRIENRESKPIQFLFKNHLAVAVTSAHRLELPGGLVTPVDLSFSTRLGSVGPFVWPNGIDAARRPIDLSVLPGPEEKHREFVYVEKLPQGWCGVRDPATGRSLRLEYSLEAFPYTWLFATYGGWRGLYAVVLEPCTNMPKDLNEAIRLGRCARLNPGKIFEATVSVAVA